MSCPKAVKGRGKARVNYLLDHPATVAARTSRVLRRHLDNHGYVTPNISWHEMADSGGTQVPKNLRKNTIRHCWNLERFSRALGKADRRVPKKKRVSITIDGPFRTIAHNIQIHGAVNSRHTYGDASDHFRFQVSRWCAETGLTESEIIKIAKKYFTAVGNETSGTLHFDSRPGRVGSISFISWIGAR